jgi:hypothetical protein
MCPACANKRVHALDDWKYHPYATHGFNGSFWTHPDLVPHDVADQAGAVNLAAGVSGEVTVAEAKAAPAGESAVRWVYLPAFLEAKWNRSTNRIGEKVE